MDQAIGQQGPSVSGLQIPPLTSWLCRTISTYVILNFREIWHGQMPCVGEWYERLKARPAFQSTYYPGSRVSEFLPLRSLYAAGRD